MLKSDVCQKCACREVGQGKQIAGGKMLPIDNLIMSFGSNIIADICTECGYIIEMRVEKPYEFK